MNGWNVWNYLQSTTHTVLNALRKQGYKLNIAMRCESPKAVQIAVTQNLGIGLLYYDAVKAAIERGSFKTGQIIGLKMEGQTHIIYHNQRPLSPNAEEFLKLLRDWRDQQNTKSVHSSAQRLGRVCACSKFNVQCSMFFGFDPCLRCRIILDLISAIRSLI